MALDAAFLERESIGGNSSTELAEHFSEHSGLGVFANSVASKPRMRRTRLASSKVKNNLANMTVMASGDSLTAGSVPSEVNMFATSWPTIFAAALKAMGYSVSNNSLVILSSQTTTAAGLAAADSRFSFNTGWAIATESGTIGTRALYNSTNGATASFTPADTDVDTFTVYTFGFNDPTTMPTIVIDTVGANPSSIPINRATTGVYATTITVPIGSVLTWHTTWPAATNVWGKIYSITGTNSYRKQIRVLNGGAAGTKAEWFSDTTYNATLGVIVTLAPDLLIHMIGPNDWVAGTVVGTFTAQIQATITAQLAYGDIVLVTPPPSAAATVALATQKTYVDAIIALGALNKVYVIDLWNTYPTQEIGLAEGYMGDALHPNAAGYLELGNYMAAVVNSLLQ